MSHLTEAYYQQDQVRVFSKITLELSTLMGARLEPQAEALQRAEDSLAALDAAGNTPPADLAAKTGEAIDIQRAHYAGLVTEIDELLALPPDVQAALSVDVPLITQRRIDAQMWVDSIDASWPEGP
jgi:hypothetical protein